ncbi:MAG TPA: glycoside hydrolase family 3 N-terminal domain-containing protein [Gemmatimonadaceae bacterium]|nr:glycoside hydrolase family 3 N-terminal domain-containing protein [Gemmatimonadaceae bacterium]
MRLTWVPSLAVALLFPLIAEGQSRAPARELSRDTAAMSARVRSLLPRMTLEEKFWQLYMSPGDRTNITHDYSHGAFGLQIPPAATARADAQRIAAIQRYFVDSTRLGVPIIAFEEAVHGLRRPGASMFPAAIALAATWDTTMMGAVATAIAREARSRGIRQVLSPVVNIATDVRWGRVEETYGEDPFLSSAMARAYVQPFAALGIVATPKHFVANVGDGGRDSYPVSLDDRTLAALHYPPFRAAFEAGALSVMTAYNSVGGVPATQNRRLLTDALRGTLGFDGFVISDAAATGGATVLHMTEPSTPIAAQHAFEAGLDVVFQSSWPQHRPYLDAFRRGLVAPDVIDSSVARVLRAKAQIGLFDEPYGDPDSAAWWNGHANHLALARRAAAAASVLLANDGALPLSPSIGSVALIGPDAAEARLGGYSADGVAPVSFHDALRARLGDRMRYAEGPGRALVRHVLVPAGRLDVRASFFDNITLDGAPVAERADSVIDAHWTFNAPARGMHNDWYSVRWEGELTVGADSVHEIGVDGTDGWRLFLDGRLLVDNWHKQSAGVRTARVALPPGSRHAIRLEYFETMGNARVRLVWDAGVHDDHAARIDSAAALAARSDIAIVVVGIEEGEFRDRGSLALPGAQESLIRAVAATGTPTVVVLIGGSAITMPWLDDVNAVLMAWYPGEQGGSAIADVLFGDVDPAGRLPITFPVAEGQLPLVYNHLPTGRGDDYVDLTGLPLFPFGHGLSYTRFSYSDLRIERGSGSDGDGLTVRCMVRNIGTRPGDEVVQLYLRNELTPIAQPVRRLAGFTRIQLAPGEQREVTFRLGALEAGMIGRDGRRVPERGRLVILIGASSTDVRLRGEVER